VTSAHIAIFLVAVGAYVVTVCLIGLASYRKTSSEAGFLVAGRSLGPILGGATLMANQVSAGTTIGVVGFHYFSGISYAWTWPLVWIGWLVAAVFIAPKMRDLEGLTLPDYFETRYASRAARGVAAVFILITYSVMLSAQFQAGGLLFSSVTGMSTGASLLLVAGITTLYTVLGGMYSNAYVGLLKAALLLAAYALAVPYLLHHLGGLEHIGAALYAIDPRLTSNWFGWRQLMAISLALGLGIGAAPYEIAAMYSMQSKRATRIAIGYSFLFQAFIGVGVLLFGLSMRVAVPFLPNPDLATPVLGTSILPFGIGLLVLLAVVVTFTRTGGAILLTVASSVSHDLYGKLLRPSASERARVRAGRIAVVVFSLIPVAIASRRAALVNFVVIYAAKLMVSFLFVPVAVGLNWKRGTRAGALAAMIGGLATCVVASLNAHPYFHGLDPAEAGLLASAALFVGVSLATPPSPHEALAPFFAPRDATRRTVSVTTNA
jgi:Na+/proline symporter